MQRQQSQQEQQITQRTEQYSRVEQQQRVTRQYSTQRTQQSKNLAISIYARFRFATLHKAGCLTIWLFCHIKAVAQTLKSNTISIQIALFSHDVFRLPVIWRIALPNSALFDMLFV